MLEDRFTISDLLIIDMLRAMSEPELVAAHPNLANYVQRGTARPAFGLAMGSHLADLNERAFPFALTLPATP